MADLIRWRDSFSLGVPSVDHEHRELVELINELHAALHAPATDTTITEFLGELLARIGSHFALEEKLMRDSSYFRYREHKADHERLLDDIRDLMEDFENGREVDMTRLGQRLEAWFSGHFRTEDAMLHDILG